MPSLRVHVARTFRERLVGFAGRRAISTDEALLFPHCRSVHTFGMRVPLDIVMLDGSDTILAVYTAVQPWHIIRGPAGSASVIEMAAETTARRGIVPGAMMQWKSQENWT